MEPTDGGNNFTSNEKLSKQSSSKSPARPEPSKHVAPAENSWLAVPSSKQAKKKGPENRIEKIQKKRKLNELDGSEAQIDIDTSIETVLEKLKTPAENPEDEDAPSMIYGRGKIAFNQIELINRAFAGDDLEADFAAEKDAVIAEDAPKEEDLTLPGWGSWTGLGVKRRATEKKLIKKIPGIDASKRKDAKLKDVIINEKKSKAVCPWQAHN
jgi:U3 small nucleolar RNA-associated protein 14